jgi:putative endonuclease
MQQAELLNKSKTIIGRVGELLAVEYLRTLGYTIVRRNYRCRIGEIDIVARDKDVFCFIEVKARATDLNGSALEQVTERKQKKLRELAAYYIYKERPSCRAYRFDVVGITMHEGEEAKIELIKNAIQ